MNKRILILTFITIGLFAAVLVPVLQNTVFIEFEKTYLRVVNGLLESQAKMLANQVRNDLLNGNTRFVRSVLEQSLDKSGFTSFRVKTEDGSVVEEANYGDLIGDNKFSVNIYFSEGGSLWGTLELFAKPSIFDQIRSEFYFIQIALQAVPIVLFFIAGVVISYLLGYSSLFLNRFVDSNLANRISMTQLERIFWSDLISKLQVRSRQLTELVSKTVLLEEKAVFSEMSRQFAHDIRSPLSSLTLLTHGLEEENVLERKVILKEACNTILNISKELLSRTKTNNLRTSEVAPISFFESLIKEKQSEFEIGSQLTLRFTGLKPNKLNIPELWVRRVVSNLVNNSIESLSKKDKEDWIIQIVIEFKKNRMQIAVQDNGIGITDDVREKALTDIFTTKQDGNGLGLYDAKKFAVFMNGHFDLLKNDLDGATALLDFPI